MKMKLKLLSVLLAITLVLPYLLPCAAAADYEPVIDLTLLETEAHPNASNYVETRQERHERLISEGFELQEMTVANRSRNVHIEGPDGQLYETRVVTSIYTQPLNEKKVYGESFLNVITQTNVNNLLTFIVSGILNHVSSVGWIPSLLGINAQTLADFISRGEVRYYENSTVYFYDIEVRLVGTTRFYFVASSEKIDVALTASTFGYTSSGQPIQQTVSGAKSSQSPFYGSELGLGEIAVECYVTGGRYGDYLYLEEAPSIGYIPLS